MSQLTTPCATPDLSLDDLSPRTINDCWDESIGLPWRSETAPTSRIPTAMGVRRPSTSRPSGSAPPRVASPIDQLLSRRSSMSSDQPLYQSYCLGLDKVGLEEGEEDYFYDSDFWESDDEEDIYGIPDRTQSAPAVRFGGKINIGSRPKTCFPVIDCGT